MAAAPHSDKLFPGAGDSSSIGKHIKRADFGTAPWTIHDLRRTAVTGMAQLGVSPIVLAHVINHRSVTKAGVTLGVYVQCSTPARGVRRSNYGAERLVCNCARRRGCRGYPLAQG